MSAAPVRLATADVETPHPHFVGNGAVAVRGSVEMPARSGPPRPRSTETPPSTARQRLAGHHEEIARLQGDAEQAAKPTEKLATALATAMAELAAAERVLADIDQRRASAIAKAAREGGDVVTPPCEQRIADTTTAAIADARRYIATLKMAQDECRVDRERANTALAQAQARGEAFLFDVLAEAHTAAVERWAQTSLAACEAAAEVEGLESAIGERGRSLLPGATGITWLQRLERLRTWRDIPPREFGPRDVAVAAGRWTDVLEKLASDPNAAF
jgi:hypothetical protein